MRQLTPEEQAYDRYVHANGMAGNDALGAGIQYGLVTEYLSPEAAVDLMRAPWEDRFEIFMRGVEEGIACRDDYTAEELFIEAHFLEHHGDVATAVHIRSI